MSQTTDHIITDETIEQFHDYMIENEKAEATISKYLHEIECLRNYFAGEPLSKRQMIQYREFLQKSNQERTVNTKLSAISHYLDFFHLEDCKVKLLRVQRKSFVNENQELTEGEYRELMNRVMGKIPDRLYYLILTLCCTGIRVSEVNFITAEAVRCGMAEICLKGKTRTVILPKKLIRRLKKYMKRNGIVSGPLFRTRSGRAMDRSNICHAMKKLGERFGVNKEKFHPHSLRHLFARRFFSVHKNIAHLADVLGHSSIETTRIYMAVSAKEHEATLNKMNLVI